ncbi:MAG: helix-turn-helix transcriptional regulator [Gammaproteobacteria bacterium]|jgi:predicted transcriptional regulator
MLEHTRKHPTNSGDIIRFHHAGVVYELPKKVAERYRVSTNNTVNADEIFTEVNKKYTKPGALLRGLRARENLTQIEMADKIQVTQSDISQMENGTRKIGRVIAKRIQKLFDVDYRSFLE